MRVYKATPRQLTFVDEYIKCGNATEAARKAGYSEKYLNTHATKMLQNATIKDLYEKRLAELKTAHIASEREILEFHTGIIRGEIQEEVINPVTGEHESLPAGLNIRQRSADSLLKHMRHIPSDLLTEEQKLKNEKLRAEIEALRDEQEADEDNVLIIDDLGGDEDG